MHRVSEQNLRDKMDQMSKNTGIRFVPNWCYGAYGVHIAIPNSGGCVHDFIGLGTKRETMEKLWAIDSMSYLGETKFNKYLIKSCVHMDFLNHFDGKRNLSVCHEITSKKGVKSYYCSGCRRDDLTKNDYDKAQGERTYDEMRCLEENLEILTGVKSQ